MSRPWMPLYISDYLGDTQHLSTIEHGAYMLLIMHYWQQESLPTDETRLARIARMTPKEWSNARATLAALFDSDWKHGRIDAEIAVTDEKYEKRAGAGHKGGKASALARKQAKLEAEAKQTASNASAKSNQPPSQPVIPEAKASGASAPPDPTIPERDYFLRGREVLGKGAGGLIAKLLKAKGMNVALARAAIEQASTKQNPAEYIAAAIRGSTGPPQFAERETNGFAARLKNRYQENTNAAADREPIDITPNQSGGSMGADRREEFDGRSRLPAPANASSPEQAFEFSGADGKLPLAGPR